jgi:ketosteroid isomerase-like protein
MKKTFFLLCILVLTAAFSPAPKTDTAAPDKTIDDWHAAAARADLEAYFGITTDDFVFLGTDPAERWTKAEFRAFCKPYFEKGTAWDFKPSERHWMFSADGKTAWFDEKLATWMEECRGSGVMVKQGKRWKLAYYNLTVLIENEKIDDFIRLRKE